MRVGFALPTPSGRSRRGTGIEDFFVDLMYLADDVDKALEIAAQILTLV